MDNRRLFLYLAISLAVFLAYQSIYNWLFSLPKTPTTQPAESRPAPGPALGSQPASAPAGGPTTTTSARSLVFSAGTSTQPIILGGDLNDKLRVELTPVGASIAELSLTTRTKKGYLYSADLAGKVPHSLLAPVESDFGELNSFATFQVALRDVTNPWPLYDHVWEVSEHTQKAVTFTTTLQSPDAPGGVIRVSKRYELVEGQPLVAMAITVENLSQQERSVQILQDGAIGFPEEGRYYPTRRLLVTDRLPDHSLKMGVFQRSDVLKSGLEGRDIKPSAEHAQFAWMASVNKYFGVFVRPLLPQEGQANFIEGVRAFVGHPEDHARSVPHDDTFGRMQTIWQTLQPGGQCRFPFEIYAGPKGTGELEEITPIGEPKGAFAEESKVGYSKSHAADVTSCCPCQFAWLTELMVSLLDWAYVVVRNYGLAILVLVIVVRGLLHPLAVIQQRSMYKLQESMVRIQPKLEKMKKELAGDKQKQAQEQMRIYSEEGVNPMAPLVSMIPMIIQMPLLLGLWTALSTNIHMRHAPFDGWWIRDLSAPDAFITFAGDGVTIPVLGWLPLVGKAFQNVTSLNLLPVLMGVSMWLQQKYMPKPSVQAKRDAQAKHGDGTSAEDQIRQQAMIANLMAVMFPLMFYYQPSGLALYWMFTNVFGIAESLIIRRQIRREKERKERLGIVDAPKKKRPGIMAEFFKRMAERAAELQKKADQITHEDKKKKTEKDRKGKGGRS